jgi:hypothetical protein
VTEFTRIKSIQNSLSVHTIFNVIGNYQINAHNATMFYKNKEDQIITEVGIYKAYEIY